MVWNKYRRRGINNAQKSVVSKVSNDRIFASKETLSDPIREAVLNALPVTGENFLEDSSYLNIIETFQKGGATQKLVLLEYITAEMEFGVRLVEFYSFRTTLAGNILVYGWSYKSNAIRSYRLDRVVSVMNTKISYEPRWLVEINL